MRVTAQATERELFVHDDSAAVSAWCRANATAGCVFVAPSAGARRHALQRVVDDRGVTVGLTVASPGRLLPLLESRAGLVAPARLSPALERLLIAESARAARVPLFDDDGYDPPAGAVTSVARLVRSLRLNGITPAQYVAAGGDARAADAYGRFEQRRVAWGFADEAARIARLVSAGIPPVALVFEDPAFPHRAAYELFAAAVGAASSCRIGLSELGPAGTVSPVLSRLGALGFTAARERASAPTPAMCAVGGVGMHDEVELVARHMLRLLRSEATVADERVQGDRRAIRPNDILGVAPTGTYLMRLNEACVRLGVPVASPRRVNALDVPLVRALLDAFRLLADPDEDTAERGLALLATPYLGLSLNQHDRLSRALIASGLGALRSWRRFARRTERPKFQRFAEAVSPVAARLQGEPPPRELASILTSLGLDYGFLSAGRRTHLAADRDESVRVDQQGWEALTGAVEELNDALRHLGITRMSPRRWMAELTEALAGVRVRVDARAVDGVHLTVAGAGLPRAAHVFAVGWREGLVPRRAREDPLLPDRVKRALNECGAMFPLVPDRAAHEHERRERVRWAARESLTVSWPATGEDGEQLLPSFYLDDLAITERTTRSVGDTTWPMTLAASRSERVARATFLARHRPADALGDELQPVRDTLAVLTAGERRAYEGALHMGQVMQLPPEILAEATQLAGAMSATQARMVAHCLYEHFGKQRLELKALTPPQVDQLLLGTIAHNVLTDLGRAGFDPAALDVALAAWWRAKIPRELSNEPGVNFEREMLVEQLRRLVDGERAHLDRSASRAAFFELAFGLDGEGHDPASLADGLRIALPHGTPLSHSTLRGSIDRVDVVERDGKRYGVAIDYKLGKGKSYRDEMYEMADFQLPIYCEVLPLFGIEPVGAFYVGIASGERHGVVREEFAELFTPRSTAGVKKLGAAEFGAFMLERQDALRTEIARLARGDLVTRPRKDDCKYCDLRPVCRIGTFGVGGESVDD